MTVNLPFSSPLSSKVSASKSAVSLETMCVISFYPLAGLENLISFTC
jgi:hypothetical protein